MSPKPLRSVGNWLLDALPSEDYERLLSELEPVTLSLGAVVYEYGGQMQHVYFPTTSHVSLLCTMLNGATAEMGLVGNEGVVGIALFMGGDTTPNQAVVQGGGKALRTRAKAMQDEFRRGGEFSATAAALHASADHSNFANSRLQSAPFSGTTTLPLVADDSRPHAN